MTTRNGTNQQLMRYFEEIEMYKKQDSILYHMNISKINDFEKKNGVRVRSILEDMKKIDMEHYENELIEDYPKFKTEGEGKDMKPVLKEGKTEDMHKEAYAELLKREVPIWGWW
jgi:hypothetical protein